MNILRRFCIGFTLLLSLTFITGCSKKLSNDDIRSIMPEKEIDSLSEEQNKINLSYKKDTLTTIDINSYIRTLIDKYDYEIVEEATKKGDDTVFTLYKKNEKTIHFTIYSNGNVEIEYIKES